MVGNGKIPMSVPMTYFDGCPVARWSGKKSGPYQVGIFCIQHFGFARSSVNIGSIGVFWSVATIAVLPPKTYLGVKKILPTYLSKASLMPGSWNVTLWLIQSL